MDGEPDSASTNAFNHMGIFYEHGSYNKETIPRKPSGVGYATYSRLMSYCTFDSVTTQSLRATAPSNVAVYAFTQPDGKKIYVLWSITSGTQNNYEPVCCFFNFELEYLFVCYQSNGNQIVCVCIISVNLHFAFFNISCIVTNFIFHTSKFHVLQQLFKANSDVEHYSDIFTTNIVSIGYCETNYLV
jgi:hypothetical protein